MNIITTQLNTTRLTVTALISATALIMGCSDATTPSSTQAPQSQADAHDHDGHDHDHDHDTTSTASTPDFYSNILGEITQVPVEGDPSTSLRIRHQQIPNFKTKDGTINVNSKGISGMASMTMEFPLAEGVNIDQLVIGDKVSFNFQVNWGGAAVAWEVTKIEKIDPATEIDFTNKIEEIKDAAEKVMDDMQDMTDHDDHTGHDHDMPKGP